MSHSQVEPLGGPHKEVSLDLGQSALPLFGFKLGVAFNLNLSAQMGLTICTLGNPFSSLDILGLKE